MAGGLVAGVASTSLLMHSGNLIRLLRNARPAVRFRRDDGALLKLFPAGLGSFRMILPGEGEEWRVQVQLGNDRTLLVGDEAQRFAGAVLPRLDRAGGSAAEVRSAVSEIERAGGADPFLLELSERAAPRSGKLTAPVTSREDPRTISNLVKPLLGMPVPVRLAAEMALHEEQERRALEGELALLETASREAEEIAAIADDLLVPDSSRRFLDNQRSAAARDAS